MIAWAFTKKVAAKGTICQKKLPTSKPAAKREGPIILLVDLFSRKLTGQLIERAEYRQIFSDAFSKYAINESALFRYAGRRHLEADIRRFIKEETNIQLRSEEWA